MKKIKIIIVDDHMMLRTGLALLLKENKNIEIIAEASDGKEFLNLLKSHHPDLVFMDIRMPNINGIDATREAIQRKPGLKIVALSMHDDEEYLESMMQAGAKGFLLKKAGSDELQKAIEVIMSGGNYFSQEIMSLFAKKMISSNDREMIELNSREKEVLKLLCQGFSTQEMADKLSLSPRTIESYRTNLLDKTNSKNTINLVLFAIKNKIVNVTKI